MKKLVALVLMLLPLCAASAFAQTRTVLFPWFASGAGGQGDTWTCEVYLTNQGFEAVEGINVSVLRDNGSALSVTTNLGTNSQFTFTLAAGATQVLRLTPGSTLLQGHIQVDYPNFTSPVRGSIISRWEKDGTVLADVGLPQQELGDHFSFPVDRNSGQGMSASFGMTNPMDASQTFVINLIRSDGTVAYTATRNLAAFAQIADYVEEMFPQMPLTFTGSVSISSQWGAGVAAFRWDKNAFAGVSTDGGPVIPSSFLVTNGFTTDADSFSDYANDYFEEAQAISLPVRVSGSINYPWSSDLYPEDWDFYTFNGQANQILTIICDTTQLGTTSLIDPIVRVYDSNRIEIAYNDQNGLAPGLYPLVDSFIQIRLPSTGTYYVSVYDFYTDVGNATDYQYRLHLKTR